MLNTYIKNRGVTQTIFHNSNNNQNGFNEINWDADYDGNTANISVTTDSNGVIQHYDATLDNIDLEKLLNIPSVDMLLDKRLTNDFANQTVSHDPRKYYIELPDTEPETVEEPLDSIQLGSVKPHSYISSPLSNEEIIVPITLDDKKHKHHKYTLTAKKHHRRKKTHNTYRVYKRNKSSTKSAKTHRSKSRSHSKRASLKPLSIF